MLWLRFLLICQLMWEIIILLYCWEDPVGKNTAWNMGEKSLFIKTVFIWSAKKVFIENTIMVNYLSFKKILLFLIVLIISSLIHSQLPLDFRIQGPLTSMIIFYYSFFLSHIVNIYPIILTLFNSCIYMAIFGWFVKDFKTSSATTFKLPIESFH